MGNYRFRMANMMPSSWFYKLKDTSTNNTAATNKTTRKQPIKSSSLSAAPTTQPTEPHHEDQPAADQRKSYYFTRDLNAHKEEQQPSVTRSLDPPRKSSRKRRPTNTKKPTDHRELVSGEPNSGGRCSCRVTPEPVWAQSYPDSTLSDGGSGHESLHCPCRTNSSSDDIFQKVDLPPIITKPEKPEGFGSSKWVIEEGGKTLSVKVVKEGNMGVSTKERSPVRRFPGGKAKANGYSPRVGSRVRVQAINGGRRSMGNRRNLSESMAVVKTSFDPQRDFKESMMEMMMANNMRSSKDLEDLLACYLSLNSEEYHEMIIKVFKQIWFESSDIRL